MDTSTAVDICYDCIKFWTDECCPREPSVRGSVKKKTNRHGRSRSCNARTLSPSRKKKEANTDREFIVDQLIGLGFSPINLGFDCLTEALLLVIADPSYIHGITTRLYPDVAENCSSTKARVERNIRAEISRVLRNDDRLLARIGSGVPISKITNGHLISALSRFMIKQYDLQNSLKRGAVL